MKQTIQVKRMFKRYAVITTSAKILGRVLATDIDIAKIRDYFIDYHAHTVSERWQIKR